MSKVLWPTRIDIVDPDSRRRRGQNRCKVNSNKGLLSTLANNSIIRKQYDLKLAKMIKRHITRVKQSCEKPTSDWTNYRV